MTNSLTQGTQALEVVSPRPKRVQSEPPLSLSAREQEIVRLVALGLPNKGIGAVLEISPWTVATHLRRIYAKLNVPSRAAMVAAVAEQRGNALPESH